MLTTIGEITGQGQGRRSGSPVRRHSRAAGYCEGTFWRRTNRQEVSQIMLAARRYELAGKQHGKRNGPLGGVGLEVLQYLANLIDFRTGRLEPSITFLMERLKRSKDAITRALYALRTHGFLDWLRRYVPTGNEGRGPQVQQTSNAYRLSMPAKALQLLGRLMQPVPKPDDFTHAQQQRAAELNAYRQTLPLDELALFELGDNDLGRTLARLGRLVQERESVKRSESQTRFLDREKNTESACGR